MLKMILFKTYKRRIRLILPVVINRIIVYP